MNRASLLPPDILPLFGDSFVKSCDLYEEYVFRLTLDVFRRAGLPAVCASPVTTDEAIAKAGFLEHVARVPLDWILRGLASRGVLQTSADGPGVRYRLPGDLPELDAASVSEAQARHDPSALPSYAIAALAAAHYPEVLRGETSGESVLLGPERIGAWFDYFSQANVLYAISNSIGAIACDGVSPDAGGAILELGGGSAAAPKRCFRVSVGRDAQGACRRTASPKSRFPS